MGGLSEDEFFDQSGWDPITYTTPHRPDTDRGEYYDPLQGEPGFLESRRIASDQWRVYCEPTESHGYPATHYRFVTPKGELSLTLAFDPCTAWVIEPLIKQKRDIELIGEFATAPKCDVAEVNRCADQFGQRGLVRGYICCFDVFGQPGTWQDATCLMGTERLILEATTIPAWVHELLRDPLPPQEGVRTITGRGAVRHAGIGRRRGVVHGDLAADVRRFRRPLRQPADRLAHRPGQRISYHTCGGMMPMLERIAAMKPDAMETFTPPAMGGDVDLAEARRRMPPSICMIGGFDQFHYFQNCTEEQTRAEVRRCFTAAGRDGAYILCPSDNFFEAEPALIKAFADEAQRCIYEDRIRIY